MRALDEKHKKNTSCPKIDKSNSWCVFASVYVIILVCAHASDTPKQLKAIILSQSCKCSVSSHHLPRQYAEGLVAQPTIRHVAVRFPLRSLCEDEQKEKKKQFTCDVTHGCGKWIETLGQLLTLVYHSVFKTLCVAKEARKSRT